jgi:tRNA threonylcarbamoyl adenosine modification protein YeaZ
MVVLGIEGALGVFSVAVVRDGETLAVRELAGNSALEEGLGAISSVLGDTRPDRIGVGVGPGRFTGLRIAISYAKALAQAWKVPLVGIPSSELVPEGVFARLGERDFTVASIEPPVRTPALSVALLAATREPAASAHAVRADYGNHPGAKVPEFKPAPRQR